MASIFDEAADLYDEVRPGYPPQLFDDLLGLAQLRQGGRALEVGSGTGQATEELARRRLVVIALEPGPRLAERARVRLAAFENISVVTTTFEASPTQPDSFDLVASATAFHWVDQDTAYKKAFESLRPGGWIGLFWNRHVAGEGSATFYRDVQRLYERWAPEMVSNFDLPPLEQAKGDERIAESGLFGDVAVRRYGWRESYDARRYVDLLRTYSDHIQLPEDRREPLLADIRRLIEDGFRDHVVLDRATVLYAAPALK